MLVSSAGAEFLCFPTSATTLHTFPNHTWAENIAVRANGQILVTTLQNGAKLWQIDPFHERDPVIVHQWSNKSALTGITELEPDVFGVIVSDLALSPLTLGSYEIWRVELHNDHPRISFVSSIPEAKLLNGMGAFDRARGTVLVADSLLNALWSVNTRTGSYKQVIHDPVPISGPNSTLNLGINGVRVFGDSIYFDNMSEEIFLKVPRYAAEGYPASVDVVANLTVAADDFTFDIEGNAYIAGSNKITKVSPSGAQCVYSAADAIQGSTSAAWGRTSVDATTLYVTTDVGKLVAIRIEEPVTN
ncbi:hypothetical protein PVAR5_8965 [Paecilomyces variotii No. 5]|uniref:SMP-30/Gluconolactonase/LRE-like region domain-containing protein n=1 Tax=Byssochlamys spectabilis (strain No. 5 / NBRC 109023) TaxID=1356009 RepID=V5I674_BYSSN|nr:hypothetical protein PVAR5_8965 [Paecilomyces variotii No. 5]